MKRWLVGLLLGAACTPLWSQDALRDQDVVRMKLRGDSDARIIETVRSSVTAFDLSDEMVAELRIAGISEAVLRAMRERQAEVEAQAARASGGPSPTPPDEPPPAVDATPPTWTVRLSGAAGVGRIPFPAAVPDALAARLELGTAPEDRTVRRAAWFAICTTATHVPDHWRSRSPLGRDFAAAPRHEMLVFVPFEGPTLELPAALEARLDPEPSHSVVVGAALEIGDRWRIVSASQPIEVPAGSGGLEDHLEVVPPATGTDLQFRTLPRP